MHLRLLIALICSCLIRAQPLFAQETAVVRWSSSVQLDSSFFRKDAPSADKRTYRSGKHLVTTEGFIYCGITFSYTRTGVHMEYEVCAVMDSSRSWLADKFDKGTLAHEQAHFNITEIFARRLRKELRHTKSVDKAKGLFRAHLNAMERKQKEFDKDHKSEYGVEPSWEEWIRNELERLVPHAGILVLPGS